MILLTNTIYYRTDKYCVNVKAKTRYVIPLVITKGKADRIVDISTKSKEKIDKYLAIPKGGYYTYFHFEFVPYNIKTTV